MLPPGRPLSPTAARSFCRLVEPRDQMSSAHAALPTALLDKMQKILIFELTATNLRGTLPQLTRKELLEEARPDVQSNRSCRKRI